MAALKRPAHLGAAGRKLWVAILAAVVDEYELDARELALLEKACGTADTVALLEKALATGSAVVTGPHGQILVNPVIAELRQQRLALARLLGAIDLGDVDETTPASRRARHAAQARWAA